MDEQSFYDCLNVSRDATKEEITLSYKNLAMKYHPDKNPDGAEKFKRITRAYRVLSDPHSRSTYDLGGESDVWRNFSQYFKNSHFSWSDMQNAFAQYDNVTLKNANSEHTLEVDLEDVYNGTTVTVKKVKWVRCTTCLGYGKSGCITCKQQKIVPVEKTYNINIKQGSFSGLEITRIGEGDATANTISGDRIFILKVRPHNFFRWSQDNLLCDFTIPSSNAADGEPLKVHTLDGRSLMLDISPNSIVNGTQIRKNNEGMPNYFDPSRKGDLIVTFYTPTNSKSNTISAVWKNLQRLVVTIVGNPRRKWTTIVACSFAGVVFFVLMYASKKLPKLDAYIHSASAATVPVVPIRQPQPPLSAENSHSGYVELEAFRDFLFQMI